MSNQICNYICRRCLSSYKSQNVLFKHKQQCEQQNLTSVRTSNEFHLYWNKHFHKNPLYLRIYADFEADNEIDNTHIGNKTTNVYRQNAVCNGYYIVSEWDDVLKIGYYECPLVFDKVDWFLVEIIKLKNKIALHFKSTKKIL